MDVTNRMHKNHSEAKKKNFNNEELSITYSCLLCKKELGEQSTVTLTGVTANNLAVEDSRLLTMKHILFRYQ